MADLSPGTVLGDRFTIVGALGRGGMATVYLADDRVRNGRVAIDALRTGGEGAAARIPDAAVRDLRDTTAELRHRAVAIGAGIASIEAALAKADPPADQAATRHAERLERLRTLERAGEATDDAAIAQARRSLREPATPTSAAREALRAQVAAAAMREVEPGLPREPIGGASTDHRGAPREFER